MKNKLFYLLVVLFFIALVVSPSYDFGLLNTGVFFIKDNIVVEDLKSMTGTEFLFKEEGLYGSVLVENRKGILESEGKEYETEKHISTFSGDLKILKINGKTQCGSGKLDIITNGLSGGLPIVLEKTGDVLNIGLGCGLSLSVLEKGDFENIDSLEIDKMVVEASKEFNYLYDNFLDDERSNIIIDDARNYLLKTEKKYDVIVNEPSHPYTKSNSNILTKEFFELMKGHIKEDGVVMQWAPINQLKTPNQDGFAIFYKTFSEVFPYIYVFVSKIEIPKTQIYSFKEDGEIKIDYREIYDPSNPKWRAGEMILMGSLKSINIQNYFNNFDKDSELGEYFQEIRIFDINDYYLFSSEDVEGFSREFDINTGDKPVLEFIAAKNLYLEKNGKSPEWIKFKGGNHIDYIL